MTLKIAVQMDPIERINIKGDSTFALMLEAQRRGHTLFVYEPEKLSLVGSEVVAPLSPVSIRDEAGNHVSRGEAIRTNLKDVDVVLLRQDPPFDMAYLTTTYLLERIHPETLVVNHPRHVRDAPEKLFVTHFQDLMPPTLISREKSEIEAFRQTHGDVVMKPLYGNGGEAVFRVEREDMNFGSLYDLFAKTFREPWVIQKFLPEVKKGDKRIILVDGVAKGAINRVPAKNDIRSNMVRGGAAEASGLTARENEICQAIGDDLRKMGLIFTGIDVIDGYLTEINVTSPTGLRAIKNNGGPDLSVDIWDAIEGKLG